MVTLQIEALRHVSPSPSPGPANWRCFSMPGTSVLSAEVLEYPPLWNRNHAGRSSFHHLALSRGLGRGRLCLRVSESDVRLIAKMVPALLYSKKLMCSCRKNNKIKSRINCERLGLDWMKCDKLRLFGIGRISVCPRAFWPAHTKSHTAAVSKKPPPMA